MGEALSQQQVEQLAETLRSWRQPRWWRLRRRVAFFLGLTCGLPLLGYLIDVDRDRHADLEP